jgi:chemotaxis protein methyltransferase CheR
MECETFLKEIAPVLGLQWRPFQRRGMKRKLERRISETGLSGFEDYLARARSDPEEQRHLSRLLTVTISRFFRDKEVFHLLETSLVPALAEKNADGRLNLWSIGCASGEEPYGVAMLWKMTLEKRWPSLRLSLLATDIDGKLLERAREGGYKKSSLEEVPEEHLRRGFEPCGDRYILNEELRRGVEFKEHDVVREEPFLEMDLIFCRNLAFTYFSKEVQIQVLKKISTGLRGEGYLVIGKEEDLPLTYPTLFVPVFQKERIYQKFGGQ